ncbi:glycosyltransferase family 2 protein [Aurantiacibacter poecillastricola]|uniref:glycosyltransferase family 2 protein n=1 Tax=Aurantiacibacter poecillastricola TaxID=3064385 RepID=UPI00273D054A|nr:glycosyltransferase [Aurantiacibacter sp. 219JJ12-13]MDP5263169.1 glycosyltransferase [Aurantiacibacter sp. 219JJ12-13]
MSTPRVTVVMSVYNDGPFVGHAIDSMLDQTFGNFEFLIVDDRSNDDSADVIAERAASDPRIRVLPSPEKGRIPALNTLLSAARGEWIALMDSDDYSMPDRLEKQLALADSDPRLGVIACHATLIDAAGKTIGEDPMKPLVHEEFVAALEDKPLLNHNAVIYRREAVLAVGGYHRAFIHAEDYDLWTRLIDRVRFANLPDRLVTYRLYPGQTSSRHVVAQTTNAVVSYLAYRERAAGRPDPTAHLHAIPPIDALDLLFGHEGAASYVRSRIVERVLYSPEALSGEGYEPILGHIAEHGAEPRLWRASARLLKAGHPGKAAGMARALMKASHR